MLGFNDVLPFVGLLLRVGFDARTLGKAGNKTLLARGDHNLTQKRVRYKGLTRLSFPFCS
jgi:hypothetical protein